MNRTALLGLALIGLSLVGCPQAPQSRPFTMSLGTFGPPCQPNENCTLDVPASVGSAAPLKVRLSVVTSSGCQSFDRFDSKRSASQLEITAIGKETDGPCTQVAGAQWVEYTDPATPARTSPFSVIVRQPSGPDFERQVTVTP